MHYLSVILFALSANIDSLAVGTAYGMKKIKISALSNFIIALISVAGTVIAMLIGLALSKFIPVYIANIIGNLILIAIGLWFLKDYIMKNIRHKEKPEAEGPLNLCAEILDNPEKADADSSGEIDLRETVILTLALTINNFGLGIGASIAGFNIAATAVFTFIFSLVFIRLGYKLGKGVLSNIIGKYTDLVSGIVIIALGIIEMFT